MKVFILQNVICSWMTQYFIQNEKASCKLKIKLKKYIEEEEEEEEANHMLTNPV